MKRCETGNIAIEDFFVVLVVSWWLNFALP